MSLQLRAMADLNTQPRQVMETAQQLLHWLMNNQQQFNQISEETLSAAEENAINGHEAYSALVHSLLLLCQADPEPIQLSSQFPNAAGNAYDGSEEYRALMHLLLSGQYLRQPNPEPIQASSQILSAGGNENYGSEGYRALVHSPLPVLYPRQPLPQPVQISEETLRALSTVVENANNGSEAYRALVHSLQLLRQVDPQPIDVSSEIPSATGNSYGGSEEYRALLHSILSGQYLGQHHPEPIQVSSHIYSAGGNSNYGSEGYRALLHLPLPVLYPRQPLPQPIQPIQDSRTIHTQAADSAGNASNVGAEMLTNMFDGLGVGGLSNPQYLNVPPGVVQLH